MKKTLVGALLLSTTLFGGNLITFVPGTKAKASEVNANFDELNARTKNITSLNNNIGIGITNPKRKLEVNGHIIVNTDLNSPFESGGEIVFANGNANNTPTWHIDNASDIFRIFHQDNINTSGHEYLTITPSGNIAIRNSYIQLSLTSGNTPPNSDCDESLEYGRMKVDEVNSLLYICTQSGWVSK